MFQVDKVQCVSKSSAIVISICYQLGFSER